MTGTPETSICNNYFWLLYSMICGYILFLKFKIMFTFPHWKKMYFFFLRFMGLALISKSIIKDKYLVQPWVTEVSFFFPFAHCLCIYKKIENTLSRICYSDHDSYCNALHVKYSLLSIPPFNTIYWNVPVPQIFMS